MWAMMRPARTIQATMLIKLLDDLSVYSVLVPFVTGLVYYRHLDLNSKLVLLLIAAATIPQLASSLLPHKNDVWPYYNTYAVIDGVMWALIFFTNSRHRPVRQLIVGVSVLALFGTLAVFVAKGITNDFRNEVVCLNSLLQVVWVLTYIYERYITEDISRLEREPMFWFCMGLLLYAPVTYFLFVYYELIINPAYPHLSSLWTIHHLLNTCMYLIFSIGMYMNRIPAAKVDA